MPELLPKKEQQPLKESEEISEAFSIDPELIESIYTSRLGMLQNLKTTISLKLYFALEEKIQNEKKSLEKLLGLEKGQKNNLSRYTFVLDSQYFEQTFLNT